MTRAFAEWKAHGVAFTLGLPNERWGSRTAAAGWQRLFPLQWLVRPLRPEVFAARRFGVPWLRRASVLSRISERWLRNRLHQDPRIEFRAVSRADDTFDRLWERCRSDAMFSAVRDSAWVQWRFLSSPTRKYDVVLAYRDGAAVGYRATHVAKTDVKTSAFLAEIVAPHGDHATQESLLADAIASAHEAEADILAALAVPGTHLHALLRRAGFVRGPAFGVHVVPFAADLSLDPLRKPENWRLSGAELESLSDGSMPCGAGHPNNTPDSQLDGPRCDRLGDADAIVQGVAAALRRTTERLAREVAYPTGSEPDWSELEWAIARSAAAMQGISTLLANNLSWSGPPAWREFLAEQREQSMLRDARIGALLEHIDAAARKRGIECVALKGAALRALDLYRPGERPMGDVDLLVAEPRSETDRSRNGRHRLRRSVHEAASSRLRAAPKVAPRGFGEHVDNPLKIEMHTVIAEPLPVRKVDITERLKSGRARPGRQRLSRPTSLLLHLLLHAAGNMRAHTLRQVQLHDIAMVAGLFYEHDWRALLEQRHDGKNRGGCFRRWP